MFGIGMQEVVIILVVALIFIGPAKLPQVARSVGKGLRELRRASDDLKSAVMVEMDDEEDWRQPAKKANALPPYADQSVSSSEIAAGLVAGDDDTADASSTTTDASRKDASSKDPSSKDPSSDPEVQQPNTVSRETSSVVASTPDSGGPDPMDADDHSGMPFAPNSPEMNDAIEDAKTRLSAKTTTESTTKLVGDVDAQADHTQNKKVASS